MKLLLDIMGVIFSEIESNKNPKSELKFIIISVVVFESLPR